MMKAIVCACAVLLGSARITRTIENKASGDSENNISQFVGQLTSLLNQGGIYPGSSNYPGVLGYQSGGFPGPYPPPGPGQPFPHPGSSYSPPPTRPYPSPPGTPYPPPGRPYPPPPPGPYPPPFQQYPGGYPGQGLGAPPTSLVGALSSIARYDDLRCVPRLLCEVASGSRPGSVSYGGYPSYQQPSPLPFLSKDALVTLLTVLNFVDDSPLLVFGRAALLGYTARGDSRACLTAYPTCPRDPDRLVDYLNNHNGGFFRFFNQQLPQYAPQYQQYQPPQYPPYPQRPYPPPNPQRPHQYPLRPGFPQQYSSQNQRYQSRIQTKPEEILEYNYYTSLSTPSPIAQEVNSLVYSPYKDYQDNPKPTLVFPQVDDHQSYHYTHSTRGGKGLSFPSETPRDQLPMVFPDRTGTGALRLDVDELGNFKTVYYGSQQNRDQRQVVFPQPQTMAFPKK